MSQHDVSADFQFTFHESRLGFQLSFDLKYNTLILIHKSSLIYDYVQPLMILHRGPEKSDLLEIPHCLSNDLRYNEFLLYIKNKSQTPLCHASFLNQRTESLMNYAVQKIVCFILST